MWSLLTLIHGQWVNEISFLSADAMESPSIYEQLELPSTHTHTQTHTHIFLLVVQMLNVKNSDSFY